MDLAQGVHDALRLDASQRPAAQREVEPTPLHVERVGIVDAERDAIPQLGGQRRGSVRHSVGIGIEGVHLASVARGEPRQPPFTAADLQDPHALEVRNFGDRGGLNALGIAHLHPEDDTDICALDESIELV